MTRIAFTGDVFIAFSPAFVVFVLAVCRDNRLVILSIGGAFSWMLSVLLASMFWYVVAPMQAARWFTVLWSVVFQELVRAGFCHLVFWTERRLNAVAADKKGAFPNHLLIALAVGVGTGTVYVLVNVVPVIWEALGPGTLFAAACPSASLFTLAAIHGMLFSLLHMVLSVVAFVAYEFRRWLLIAVLWGAHFSASYVTLFNDPRAHCAGSIAAVVGVILATVLCLALISTPLATKKRSLAL
jgi:anterior pharynx defective protein 1